MSGGKICECPEVRQPIGSGAGSDTGRLWRVVDRECNYSAFNGGRWTPSRYSLLTCLRCGAWWRSKGSYVRHLKDRAESERVS